MVLDEYRRKRDFNKTQEPSGGHATKNGRQRFVIQKHAASRLHYDFRLELDGVLKSWAVPKGPPLDPSIKSLAVEVEDHPLDYANFEGTIPAGQYGGGTVMIWDQGTWRPEGDALTGLRRGKLNFELAGEKLHGNWSLVRMHGRDRGKSNDKNNWLLLKRDDESARRGPLRDDKAKSVVSGRTMEEIAAAADRVWQSDRAEGQESKAFNKTKPRRPPKRKGTPDSNGSTSPTAAAGAQCQPMPTEISPQLATLVREVPSGDQWVHELKFDGYRLLAFVDSGHVKLCTRKGNDWTAKFPSLATALAALEVKNAIFDGEVVALDKNGATNFQKLQNWLHRGNDDSLVYYVFDLPYLNNISLAASPLSERKALLEKTLLAHHAENEGPLRYSEHIQGQGPQVVEYACRSHMEGVISKRLDSPYSPGRTTTWVKTKCLQRQEFVIGGFTKPAGSRTGFGALLLGIYDGDQLTYCGNVGTGFSQTSLAQIKRRLDLLKTKQPPFENPPRAARRNTTWVKPELVAEVEFAEWTEDGMLRHPSFQGLREDKPAREIGRESARESAPSAEKSKARGTRTKSPVARSRNGNDATIAGITLTHPDRVIYPEQKLTKLDLANFYKEIADWILPHVANRPLTIVRCPQGSGHQCFYQKHLTEAMPDVLVGVPIDDKGTAETYVGLKDLPGLIALVQMGVLEFHPWGAKADDVERPDRLIFDLDPGAGVAWPAVVKGAQDLREFLAEQGLECFLRTSGGKGLHIVVPLVRRATWDVAKEFAHNVALALTNRHPARYLATMSKAQRRGKVFIDYLRNQRGATAVASYSTRARANAPVATPLLWDELKKPLVPDQFTVRNLPERLAKLKSDPWQGFFEVRQSLTAKITRATAQLATA